MPYKANEARRHKIPRARYKVTNWPEYDRALQQRGSLTVWVTPEALAAWQPPRTGQRGRPRDYSEVAIETGHLLRLAFGRPWRQTEGLLRSLVILLGVDVGIPDHTTVSRRSPGLGLAASLAQARASGPVHVVINATGLGVYGAGGWLLGMGWTAPDGIDVPDCGSCEEAAEREPPTMSITMIGLDTAKSAFQGHAVNEAGKMEIRRKLRRDALVSFFTKQDACTVVMEACSAAHHWARLLTGLGHTVKLIAPETVRPFVKQGKKNDAADAAAICEAASRPDVRFVPAKSLEQQGILALHSARSLLIKQQTMLANAMGGLAAEFGVIVSKGISKLGERVAQVEADEAVPEPARQAIGGLLGHCDVLAGSIKALEAGIVVHARRDDTARRLATIPGIGPITASMIAATVVDIGMFKSARHFAAWLGLVPRQHSTGGRTRLGRITKTGNREIRRLLVLGATSMIYRAETWNSAAGAWVRKILERRPARLATVALANKMARIAPRERPSAFPPLSGTDRFAMAVMTRNEVYRPKGGVATAVQAAA